MNGNIRPFISVQSAWFWFARAWQAYLDGARYRAGQGEIMRPCEPIDIMCVIDRLYRNRVLTRDHLKVLSYYGKRGDAPVIDRKMETRAYHLWQEAMARIEPILIAKGIVAQ